MGRLSTNLASSFPARCLGVLLAVLLAFTPLGHACAMGVPAPEQPDTACHHAKPGGDPPGDCVHHPGNPCHCAAAGVALPASPITTPSAVVATEPVSIVALVPRLPVGPDTPPPRP